MSQPKRAIIIGASSGIGRSLTRLLVQEGWRIGVLARRKELLDELSRESPDSIVVRAADLSSIKEAGEAVEQLLEELGGLELGVLSAGVGDVTPNLGWQETQSMLDINVRGWTAVANRLMRTFEEQGRGQLVNFSSLAALRGHGGAPAYYASKAFASNYMQGLRHRVAKKQLDITVTDLQLGLVRTAMAKVDSIPRWVVGPETASKHIWRAIRRRRAHAYVTPGWRLVAWAIRIAPTFLWHRF